MILEKYFGSIKMGTRREPERGGLIVVQLIKGIHSGRVHGRCHDVDENK
jgi:hypothetical protein